MIARASALVLIVGCAGGATSVRGIDGQPLPTTARIDADASVEVRCDGARYVIVPTPPAYVAGLHVQTERPYVHDLPALCERIRAAD